MRQPLSRGADHPVGDDRHGQHALERAVVSDVAAHVVFRDHRCRSGCISQQSDFTDNRPWRQLAHRDLSIRADVPDLDSTGRDDRKRHRSLTLPHQDLAGGRMQGL
jgi:hypothetical protein